MKLELGLLAAAANTSAGESLNVLGEFNLIQTRGEGPVVMPASLVLRLVAEPAEIGMHSLGIRLREEDGDLLWTSPDVRVVVLGFPASPRFECGCFHLTIALKFQNTSYPALGPRVYVDRQIRTLNRDLEIRCRPAPRSGTGLRL